MVRKQNCPTCGKTFSLKQGEPLAYFPFCSDRCKLVDLGRWFDGGYVILPDGLSQETQGQEGSDES